MAIKKQNWSTRLESAWALEFTKEAVEHEFWLYRTEDAAYRAMAAHMRQGMDVYGLGDHHRATVERYLRERKWDEAIREWWELFEQEYHVEEHEIE